LLDQARELDLRSPHQDFFDPIWRQGWRAADLVELGADQPAEHELARDDAALGNPS